MMEVKTKIGMIMDAGDVETRRKLAQSIQGGSTTTSTLGLEFESVSASESVAPHIADSRHLAMYTMRLREWCDQKQKSVRYHHQQLSVLPVKWEAKVSVDGMTFTGAAERRKQADHFASKNACEALGVTL